MTILTHFDYPTQTMGLLPDAEQFRAIVSGKATGFAATAWRALFWWLRWPYGLGVLLRNWLYNSLLKKSVRVPATVISVGNLTLGGTGKTPCVEYLARRFRDQGFQVAIISRGYGAESGPNDEALMLEQNLPDVPHLQNRDRVEAALTAITELEAEVLILDDGFQHRRLSRDFDLVLIDHSANLFSDYLFPRGTLREPLSSLNRADAIILTRCESLETSQTQRAELLRCAAGKPIFLAKHQPSELVNSDGITQPIYSVNGLKVAMLCGIGHPDGFRRTIQDLTGQEPIAEQVFADHHNYTRRDVERLRAWADSLPESTLILTTQKDLVKLRLAELSGRALWAVRIEFALLENADDLDDLLRAKLPSIDEV